jgi:hypothetical protein
MIGQVSSDLVSLSFPPSSAAKAREKPTTMHGMRIRFPQRSSAFRSDNEDQIGHFLLFSLPLVGFDDDLGFLIDLLRSWLELDVLLWCGTAADSTGFFSSFLACSLKISEDYDFPIVADDSYLLYALLTYLSPPFHWNETTHTSHHI